MMNKPFFRYALSPLCTLLALLFIHLMALYGLLTVSLALPVGVMVLCLFWSGLRANILSAIFITAYALGSGLDPSRSAQVIFFAALPIAIFGGVFRRWLIESVAETERQRLRAAENQEKADRYDELNGNLERLKRIHSRLFDLNQGWDVLSEQARRAIVQEVGNEAGNLRQATEGWSQLAKVKKEVIGDEQEPKQEPI